MRSQYRSSSDLHSKLPTKIVPSLPGGAWPLYETGKSEQVHSINSLTHLCVPSASTAFQMRTMVLEAEQTSLLCRKFFTPQEQKVWMSHLMLLMPRESLFAAMGLFCTWLLIIKTPTPVFLEPGIGFQVFSLVSVSQPQKTADNFATPPLFFPRNNV